MAYGVDVYVIKKECLVPLAKDCRKEDFCLEEFLEEHCLQFLDTSISYDNYPVLHEIRSRSESWLSTIKGESVFVIEKGVQCICNFPEELPSTKNNERVIIVVDN